MGLWLSFGGVDAEDGSLVSMASTEGFFVDGLRPGALAGLRFSCEVATDPVILVSCADREAEADTLAIFRP